MDSHEVRREWAGRSGEYSPEYYSHYGPDETSETLRSILDRTVGSDAAVLELGCSSGRHLAHLADAGYDDLTGIEINGDAFDVMTEHYPDLAATGTFYHDAIENVVEGFGDDEFDAVYSVETLQHLHPEAEWVYAELARIAADVLVTVEIESEVGGSDGRAAGADDDCPDVNYVDEDVPLYYRDWGKIFTDRGLTQVDVTEGERDTIRTFRQDDAD